MKPSAQQIACGGPILTRALQDVRRKRGMSKQAVADSMGMALRTYEEFEAGRGPQSVDRVLAFSEATDCDPYALILGSIFDMPEFGVHCADNKLCLIMMMHLEEFAAAEGGDLAFLEPAHLIGGFGRLFKDFGAKLEESERFLRNWLDGRTGSVGLKALRLRGLRRKPGKD
jgi:transcriptional regulator with XRE-family HTH domain